MPADRGADYAPIETGDQDEDAFVVEPAPASSADNAAANTNAANDAESSPKKRHPRKKPPHGAGEINAKLSEHKRLQQAKLDEQKAAEAAKLAASMAKAKERQEQVVAKAQEEKAAEMAAIAKARERQAEIDRAKREQAELEAEAIKRKVRIQGIVFQRMLHSQLSRGFGKWRADWFVSESDLAVDARARDVAEKQRVAELKAAEARAEAARKKIEEDKAEAARQWAARLFTIMPPAGPLGMGVSSGDGEFVRHPVVTTITPGKLAASNGVQEGCLLVSVNGQPTEGIAAKEVIRMLKAATEASRQGEPRALEFARAPGMGAPNERSGQGTACCVVS